MTDPGTDITIVSRGLNIRALSWGDSGQRPMLAMHGWLDNAQSFRYLAPLIKNRHIVAIDFPGHGRSDHRHSGSSYFFADYVLDAVHVIKELGWNQCDLLGHSMGAGVASFAAACNDSISSIHLIDGIGPYTEPDDKAAEGMHKAVHASLASKPDTRISASLDELLARRARASADVDAEALRSMVERAAKQSSAGWQWCTDPRLKLPSPMRFNEAATMNLLQQIRCPVLYFAAEQGLFAKSPLLDARLACISDLEHHLIDGGHHMHMGDKVALIAERMNKFLTRQDTVTN